MICAVMNIMQYFRRKEIILWNEVVPLIAYDDADAFLRSVSKIADENGIYIVISPYIIFRNREERDVNKIFIFGPSGDIVLTHYKYGGNIIEGSKSGDKIIRTIDTEFVRLTGLICWDKDFRG